MTELSLKLIENSRTFWEASRTLIIFLKFIKSGANFTEVFIYFIMQNNNLWQNKRNIFYFSPKATTASDVTSDKSICLLFSIYSGCSFIIIQPICVKKSPRWVLWGSALVSLYLWCIRWFFTHLHIVFCEQQRLCSMNNILRKILCSQKGIIHKTLYMAFLINLKSIFSNLDWTSFLCF